MHVIADGKRYRDMDAYRRGEAMGPRELVEDALRRLTDGSLTFRVVDEDRYSVVASFTLDRQVHGYGWSKAALSDDCEAADQGVREILRQANARYADAGVSSRSS